MSESEEEKSIMAEPALASDRDREAIQPDVLIVGGGIMGLWLLNDLLKQGYSALLLEKGELGDGQTLHSHLYLHRGHVYREAELANRLRGVNDRWQRWIKEHDLPCQPNPSFFGFRDPSLASQKVLFWRSLNLPVRRVSRPSLFEGGAIVDVYRSYEICLSGEALIDSLRYRTENFITQVRSINAIEISPGSNEVKAVHATGTRGDQLIFAPRALALTAGQGNQELLDLIAQGHRSHERTMSNAQQIRKSHMLVVRGRKEAFQPLTGVFPDLDGLFIVSREQEEHVVWLVSDFRGPALSSNMDKARYTPQWWVPKILALLQELAPQYFSYSQRENLEWEIYEAPKAEGRTDGKVPHEWRITQLGLDNLWVVWPTKLTLSPKVSEEVVSQIKILLRRPTTWVAPPSAWTHARTAPATARERWSKKPLLSWKVFRDRYI